MFLEQAVQEDNLLIQLIAQLELLTLPSGVVVSQQDEKSQHKNKAKALKILRSRVYEAEKRKKIKKDLQIEEIK